MPIQPYYTLLLAEDDADDRLLFREALSAIGNPVKLVESDDGEATINLLKAIDAPPDLIVLDINMPKVSGINCLKIIRAQSDLEKIPVFIMSTCSDEKTIAEARKAGATKYVIKPADFNELVNIVRVMCLRDVQTLPQSDFVLNTIIGNL